MRTGLLPNTLNDISNFTVGNLYSSLCAMAE